MSSTKSLVLYQPMNGYCYNSDTHFLYDFICTNLKKYKNIQGKLLDVGSGSGILGLLLARDFPKLQLHQCEIQEEFQFFSQKNAFTNKLDAKLHCGDFTKIEFQTQFEIIVSNPPFYHSDVIKSENTNLKIARYSDFMPLEQFIAQTSNLLTPKGRFFFCYDAKQLDTIVLFAHKYRLKIETIQALHPNRKKEASLIMIALRKSSKTPLKILPPVVMFDESNEFQKEVQELYKRCNTHSIKCNKEKIVYNPPNDTR